MRIAFITVGDPSRLTGGYLYHRELFARLRAGGITVEEIVAAPADLPAQLAAVAAVGRDVDPERYDLLVVDALARAVCAPWLDQWRLRRPLVAMIHELPSVAAANPDPAEFAWEAPLLRADRLITVSDDGAWILQGRGVAPERIAVVSGGYDRLTPVHQYKATAEPIALCVAQWIPRKGLHELARVWARTVRPGWCLELVGETEADPAYAALVRMALATAPAGSVRVRGRIDDAALAAAYGRAALFVLPSHYEGYGIAFAEALAFGLPVVSCAVGPLPSLLGNEAALLVPAGSEADLAAALGRLMDDQLLCTRMAAAALRRAADLPTWERCAANFRAALVVAKDRS
jgi:glycosyltransferase involved in cell wall biosynthesis